MRRIANRSLQYEDIDVWTLTANRTKLRFIDSD